MTIARFGIGITLALSSTLAITVASTSAGVANARTVAGDPEIVELTVPGLVSAATRAIEAEDLEGYWLDLGDALRSRLGATSSRAFLRFLDSPAGELASLQWMLLSRLGPGGLREVSGLGLDEGWSLPERRATLTWILADPEILGGLLGAGDLDAGSWAESLSVFCRLLESDPDGSIRKEGLPRRLAIATALTWSEPVRWMADGSEIDPVGRWRSFLVWDDQGLLYETFRDLCTWELRYVVGSWSSDDDLVWARANIKDELRRRDKVGDAAHMLSYNLFNQDGVSVQEGRRFYDDKPMTMAIMLEYGGVCGAISRFGSSMSQAFGVPAMPVGQPGHCAFLWQKEPHRWSINNDISGWAGSSRHAGIQVVWSDLVGARAWLVPLMQDAQSDAEAFLDAERLLAVADGLGEGGGESGDDDAGATDRAEHRLDLLEEACRRCPLHLAAWCGRAEAVSAGPEGRRGLRDAQRLSRDAAKALGMHPTAYAAVVSRLDERLVPPDATPRQREGFAQEQATRFMTMARRGAEGGLAARGLREVLARQSERLAPGARGAARAIPEGGRPRGRAISEADAVEVFDLVFGATLELDVVPEGPPHAAWRRATADLVDGVVLQPALHGHGLVRMQALVRRLARSGRLADARWLADRIVDSTGKHGDEGLQEKAKVLRAELG